MKKLFLSMVLMGSCFMLSGCALFDIFTGTGGPEDMLIDAEIEDILGEDGDKVGEAREEGKDEVVKVESVETFTEPPFEDTMKSRCGASVDYRYCKCAFHGDMCGQLDVNRKGARAHLSELFADFVDDGRKQFQENCENSGNGIWSPTELTCSYCPVGSIIEGTRCVVPAPEPEPEENDSVASGELNVDDPSTVHSTGSVQGSGGQNGINAELGRVCTCERDGVSRGIVCEGEFNDCNECCGNSIPPTTASGDDTSEPIELAEGECKWDSDCPQTCEGNTMWKWACNGQTNTCEKWTDTDCSEVITTVDWRGDEVYEVPNICVAGQGCVRGAIPIYERKDELQAEWKQLQAESQQLNELYQQAAAFCLGTLSDPTGITALAASAQDINVTSAETSALIVEAAGASDATQTSVWCTLENRLKTVDLPAIQAQLDVLLARIKEVDTWTDIVDDAN